MSWFDDWAKKLDEVLTGEGTQHPNGQWIMQGVMRAASATVRANMTDAQKWDATVTGAMKWEAYRANLFWSTVADPGFWCQLGAFLVLGVVFRSFGFGDGVHNGVLQDASTFTIGWLLEVTLQPSFPAYSMREENSGGLEYAQHNYVPRLAIVPFTSTFVPLLYGNKTGSLENIAACWVQHFIVLAFSWWALAAPVADRERDFTDRPYAQAAFRSEQLRMRMSALGPFVLCGDTTVALYEGIREEGWARKQIDLSTTPVEERPV